MNFLDNPFPFRVRNICPWQMFLFFAYVSSLRHNFVGSRMVLILPFSAISATPF